MSIHPFCVNLHQLRYSIRIENDEPQSGVATIQTRDGGLDIQKYKDCFEMRRDGLTAGDLGQVDFTWQPDSRRPDNQLEDLEKWSMSPTNVPEFRSAAKQSMNFYDPKYNDTLNLYIHQKKFILQMTDNKMSIADIMLCSAIWSMFT